METDSLLIKWGEAHDVSANGVAIIGNTYDSTVFRFDTNTSDTNRNVNSIYWACFQRLNGELLWFDRADPIRNIGEITCHGRSIRIDDDESVYSTGFVETRTRFSNGDTVARGFSPQSCYLTRHSQEGNLEYVVELNGQEDTCLSSGNSIDLNNNSVVVAGSYVGSMNIPGIDRTLKYFGSVCGFVAYFDKSGKARWAVGIVGRSASLAINSVSLNQPSRIVAGGSVFGRGRVEVDSFSVDPLTVDAGITLDIDTQGQIAQLATWNIHGDGREVFACLPLSSTRTIVGTSYADSAIFGSIRVDSRRSPAGMIASLGPVITSRSREDVIPSGMTARLRGRDLVIRSDTDLPHGWEVNIHSVLGELLRHQKITDTTSGEVTLPLPQRCWNSFVVVSVLDASGAMCGSTLGFVMASH